jgi:hypothetical protein
MFCVMFGFGWKNRTLRIACGFVGLHRVKVEQKVEHRQEKAEKQADLPT